MSQILIDIDKKKLTHEDYDRIKHVLTILGLFNNICGMETSTSQNKNKHIRINLGWNTKLTPLETVCIQALCGSDYRRECFNLMRVKQLKGKSRLVRENWNVLFKKKVKL